MTESRNIPGIEFGNLYRADPLGQAAWRRWLGEKTFAQLEPHFDAMGEAAALAGPLSARADRHGPVLETHDRLGRRVDRVVFHPDYHRLEELSYGRGIVAIKYDPKFLAAHRPVRHLVGFGSSYYFGQTEMGLYCPICMTDGVGRVLERHAPPELAREVIPRLASRELSKLWQGAMFLTEHQGGSDVGASECQAAQSGGEWRLTGDKWFCSNVTAQAILALARVDGPGTAGLGLFLVLRAEGNSDTIRIHRLKDKLGVRSMATGEVSFEGTRAHLIGGPGQGFKMMTEMLNLSRLYNAVASVAVLRRAVLEARAYGVVRQSFGRPLEAHPLWRATMSDLVAESLGMFALVFDAVRALDRADGGDAEALGFVRLAIPMAKALAGKLAVFGVSEAMEAIGGNAYIEESILPRLLRDAQVLPIWEGTTNILALDALRAIEKQSAHEALLARVTRALGAAGRSAAVSRLEPFVDELGRKLSALERLEPESRQREARAWLEAAGRVLSRALLLEGSAQDPSGAWLAAEARLACRPWGAMPVAQGGAAELRATEEPLLASVM